MTTTTSEIFFNFFSCTIKTYQLSRKCERKKKRCCKNKDVLILILEQKVDLLRTCLLRTRIVNGWSSPTKKSAVVRKGDQMPIIINFFHSLPLKEGLLNICSPKTFNIGYCVIEEEGEEWKRLDLIYRDWDCVSASYYFI